MNKQIPGISEVISALRQDPNGKKLADKVENGEITLEEAAAALIAQDGGGTRITKQVIASFQQSEQTKIDEEAGWIIAGFQQGTKNPSSEEDSANLNWAKDLFKYLK